MYLYYDKEGTLKEWINDEPLRQGSSGINFIYVFCEKMLDETFTNLWARYKLSGENIYEPSSTTYDNSAVLIEGQVPYSKKRDLKFFKYFKTYPFYKLAISDDVLGREGSWLLSLWLVNDNITTLGQMAFQVDESTLSVKIDENINVAQWNALIKEINGSGTYEELINKVTSISRLSTNTEYPSAKAVYDLFLTLSGEYAVYITYDDGYTITDYSGFPTIDDETRLASHLADLSKTKVYAFIDTPLNPDLDDTWSVIELRFDNFWKGDDNFDISTKFSGKSSNGEIFEIEYYQANLDPSESDLDVILSVSTPSGMNNPMTTADDLIIGGTGGTPTRLAKGTIGQVLKIGDNGLEWGEESGEDVPNKQMTTAIVRNELTNVNGWVLTAFTATLTEISGYTAYQIRKNGNVLTEEEARNYMEDMTGSRFLPKYDYFKPQNTYFIFADQSIWKPQFDTTNGLLLFKMANGMANPMTTAGDIIIGGSNGTPTRQSKGNNGTLLGVDNFGNLGYKHLPYRTTAPTSANVDGTLEVVVLSSEPATYYDGYYYIITGSNS